MAATQVVGYGNNTNRNVFAVHFNQGLSSAVTYHAYDGDGTWPATASATTTAHEIFSRNATATYNATNGSCVMLHDTTNAAPSADWAGTLQTNNGTSGEANPNYLEGDSDWVEQDGSTITGGATPLNIGTDAISFNMCIDVPAACQTSDNMQFDLAAKYTYTGTAPTVGWYYNTGTEGTPTWTQITVDTYGVKHTRDDVTSGYYANIPDADTELTVEAWVVDISE